ncbi:YfiR family protein [Neptunicella marina]|uniref:YfiR family protein n=1 Tax=Neptunicella marina TaxID=2125989 RepID=A0A8J6ITU3_9ALTE|nr:YfiR family protein [Neptunicella marina]MBC3766129.1 YfiR family protein [Neptunicella marina]
MNRLLMLLLTIVSLSSVAAPIAPYQIRAPLLLHMVEFTDFPRARLNFDSLSLCFLEGPEFNHAQQLSQIHQKMIKSIPFSVVRMVQLHEFGSANCHMLFVSKAHETKELFEQMDEINQTTLTIGESKEFVQQGGLLSIVAGGQNMEIVINLTQLEKSPLKISSSVLKLATFVE